MANSNGYCFSNDGITGFCTVSTGDTFIFDSSDYKQIKNKVWYSSAQGRNGEKYIMDCSGRSLHRYIMNPPAGYEVDHVDLNTLNNRKSNLRLCTHQQNQCNQPLQCNNTSGISGVSFYPPRHKYRARIKIGQQDIHLGYYCSFIEAVQARNVGMECMFGEYGRYNDAPDAPYWIRKLVNEKCERFAELSVCRAFLLSRGGVA